MILQKSRKQWLYYLTYPVVPKFFSPILKNNQIQLRMGWLKIEIKAVMEITVPSVNKLNINASLQVQRKKILTQFWIIWVFTLFHNFTI